MPAHMSYFPRLPVSPSPARGSHRPEPSELQLEVAGGLCVLQRGARRGFLVSSLCEATLGHTFATRGSPLDPARRCERSRAPRRLHAMVDGTELQPHSGEAERARKPSVTPIAVALACSIWSINRSAQGTLGMWTRCRQRGWAGHGGGNLPSSCWSPWRSRAYPNSRGESAGSTCACCVFGCTVFWISKSPTISPCSPTPIAPYPPPIHAGPFSAARIFASAAPRDAQERRPLLPDFALFLTCLCTGSVRATASNRSRCSRSPRKVRCGMVLGGRR